MLGENLEKFKKNFKKYTRIFGLAPAFFTHKAAPTKLFEWIITWSITTSVSSIIC